MCLGVKSHTRVFAAHHFGFIFFHVIPRCRTCTHRWASALIALTWIMHDRKMKMRKLIKHNREIRLNNHRIRAKVGGGGVKRLKASNLI